MSNDQRSCKEPSNVRIGLGYPDQKDMSPLKAFLHNMMPPKLLVLILELTNMRLATKGEQEFKMPMFSFTTDSERHHHHFVAIAHKRKWENFVANPRQITSGHTKNHPM